MKTCGHNGDLVPNIPIYIGIIGAECDLHNSSSELDFIYHFIDDDAIQNMRKLTN